MRLVTGDPFLDNAVADEAAACVRGGIDFEVVPGVSSLTAVPEYAGIDLIHAGGVQFASVTDGKFGKSNTVQWGAAATVVVSTRVSLIAGMVEAAKAAGRPGDDHVIVTLHGGSTDQITLPTTLDGLVASVKSVRAPAADPVHVIMGAAAEQRHELSWYETKPLFGWRVLVPRTKDQAAPMVARLRTYGAHSEEVPTISVEPPRSPLQMDKAIRGLVEGRYEWVAFTSVNAVKAVREKFEDYGLDARAFSGLKVAAVGEVTAQSLQSWGIEPDLVPEGEQSAAGLAAEFPPYDDVLDPINRVFLPRADIATETLAEGLKALGWEVEDVTAYRTVRATPPPAAGARGDQDRQVRRGRVHLVLHGAQPGRYRRQATPLDDHRGDRSGDSPDLRGARPAGRRGRGEAVGGRPGRRVGQLRGCPARRLPGRRRARAPPIAEEAHPPPAGLERTACALSLPRCALMPVEGSIEGFDQLSPHDLADPGGCARRR